VVVNEAGWDIPLAFGACAMLGLGDVGFAVGKGGEGCVAHLAVWRRLFLDAGSVGHFAGVEGVGGIGHFVNSVSVEMWLETCQGTVEFYRIIEFIKCV